MEIASDSIALRYVFSLPLIEKLAVPIWGQPGIKRFAISLTNGIIGNSLLQNAQEHLLPAVLRKETVY